MFQYYYDSKEVKFNHISKLVGKFEYELDAPYFSLFVPTIDSVNYTALLDTLIQANKRVFFTGTTGVGKTKLISQFLMANQETHCLAPVMLNFSA